MTVLTGASWIWGAARGITKHKPALDWVDPGFARGWTVYILWQVLISIALIYNYCYRMVGFMAKNQNEIVRYTSICRGIEAAGGAIASGVSSTSAPGSLILSNFVIPLTGSQLTVAMVLTLHYGVLHLYQLGLW
ncbi:hypothetical protein IFR05_009780 [Cadophora sp. M221]|nr:hypothetical protein IFR05_009780 [Cadophora sp. M221]